MSGKRLSVEERHVSTNKRRATSTTKSEVAPVSTSRYQVDHAFLDDTTVFGHGVPLRAFIDMQAAQLFNSVSNDNQMRVAILIFWQSFFMNQRGVADRAILEPLFHYLTEHCPFIDSLSQDDVEDYSQVFVDVHDGLQDEVVKEINKICDQWVESPAGTAFMEAYAKAKKNHRAKPEFSEDVFTGYVGEDGKEIPGVDIDLACVSRTCAPFLWIYELEEREENVLWPAFESGDDLIEKGDSLYNRLRTFIVQLCLAVLEVYIPRAAAKTYRTDQPRPKYSDFYNNDKHQPIPTTQYIVASWTQGSFYAARAHNGLFMPQHPPLPQHPIHRWVQVVNTIPFPRSILSASSTKSNKFRTFTAMQAAEDERREFDGEHIVSLAEKVENGVKEDKAVFAEIEAQISKNLPAYVAKETPKDTLVKITPYPLSLLHDSVAKRWATAATNCTWWGRTRMHLDDADERLRHLESLATAIQFEIQSVRARKKELIEKREKMRRVMEAYDQLQQTLHDDEKEASEVEKDINRMTTHAVLRGTLRQLKQANKSVSADLAAAFESTPPTETTGSMACGGPSLSGPVERDFGMDFSSDDDIPNCPPDDGNIEDERNMDVDSSDGKDNEKKLDNAKDDAQSS